MKNDTSLFVGFIIQSLLLLILIEFTVAGTDDLSAIILLLLAIMGAGLMFRGLWSIKKRNDLIAWNKILTLD